MKREHKHLKRCRENYPYWRGYPHINNGLSLYQIKIAEKLIEKSFERIIDSGLNPYKDVLINGQQFHIENIKVHNPDNLASHLTFSISLKA